MNQADIPAPTPEDDILPHQERIEYLIDQKLAEQSPESSVAQVPIAKTAAYTAVSGDAVLADASGGAFAVTLPAPANGAKVTVKNVGATGTVTVEPDAAETIDGGASFALLSQNESRDFLSDGTDWWVV